MYVILLFFHSLVRWLVLASLVYSIYRGRRGWLGNRAFTKSDNAIRHWTATISHIQMTIGYLLYFQSPTVKYFTANTRQALQQIDFLFFGLIHIALMTISVILITIGSSLSKRQETDLEKYRTMTIWFAVALLIIFIAIPWPFSPLANRPYLRHF
ncbi:hypothetical protein SAMN04515674_104213 [Pseudarcicella hirudinis]|uniref:Cytochrome b561 n=1 Tax=Pseudarcicella hirudinis TaxID=1079859 RepID=A0A1I5RSB4_9BACT|nr:hypothetical protein [Pseudarcicella hirudinis]SFP61270.1 hypothetical protein SAMN04515674_104213 [Pseudarcicella hirudinis]